MLFLRSRERSFAVKRDHNTCQVCGVKGSKAKGREVDIQVHHLKGARKEAIIDMVYEHLLCKPELLACVCVPCHNKITEEGET
jgi:5-methylcytosine-specific restriction endonuclease McrA